jgi:tetratricopeptide (TPR) repeat protein
MMRRVHGAEKDHTNIATSLNNLAVLYESQGRYDKAEPLTVEVLAMISAEKDHCEARHSGAGGHGIVMSLKKLALQYLLQRRYSVSSQEGAVHIVRLDDKAEPLMVEALAMARRVYGAEKDHLNIAEIINNLAGKYRSQGLDDKAEPLYVEALAMRRRIYSAEKDHPDIVASLNNLASLYGSQERYDKAEPLVVEALAMERRVHGAWKYVCHPDIVASLNNLASLYLSQGRYDKAEPPAVEALAMERRLHGAEKDHPDIATSLSNLADLYCRTGRFQEAGGMFEEAERIWLCSFGEDHPNVQRVRMHLAFCRAAMPPPCILI